jgi:hypothetical protein
MRFSLASPSRRFFVRDLLVPTSGEGIPASAAEAASANPTAGLLLENEGMSQALTDRRVRTIDPETRNRTG